MLHEIMPFVSKYGLWVIFFGMMVEGTTMILVTGILCYLGMVSFNEALFVAIAGAIIGDQFWYFMGKNYTTVLLEKFSTLKEKVKSLKPTIEKKGSWLAFGGRFVYAGAILFPSTLGIYNYSHKKFTLFDTLGVTIWAIIGIIIGYILGSGAEHYVGKIEKIWHFILLLAAGVAIIWGVKSFFTKYKKTLKEKNR